MDTPEFQSLKNLVRDGVGKVRDAKLADMLPAYRANSGCLVSDNLFLSPDWAIIDPAKAVSDLSAQKNANKKRK